MPHRSCSTPQTRRGPCLHSSLSISKTPPSAPSRHGPQNLSAIVQKFIPRTRLTLEMPRSDLKANYTTASSTTLASKVVDNATTLSRQRADTLEYNCTHQQWLYGEPRGLLPLPRSSHFLQAPPPLHAVPAAPL